MRRCQRRLPASAVLGVDPLLRRFLIALGIAASVAVIALAWISAIADPCEYTPLYERPSPTNRYVAEVYQADCGMMDHSLLLFLRDRSALTFSLSNRPPGTLVAVDEDLGPFENVVWGDEGRLTIEYSSDRHGPELRRTEWGGVRIGMLRVSPAE